MCLCCMVVVEYTFVEIYAEKILGAQGKHLTFYLDQSLAIIMLFSNSSRQVFLIGIMFFLSLVSGVGFIGRNLTEYLVKHDLANKVLLLWIFQ